MSSFNLQYNVGTYIISSETLTILREYGVRVCAMKLISGTASYTGSMKLGSRSSELIPLTVNEPVTVSGEEPLNEFSIDASGGVVYVVVRN